MRPSVSLQKKSGSQKFLQGVQSASRTAAYVGIPAANSRTRQSTIAQMAATTTGKRKKHLAEAAAQKITNAEALFIFTKGSPARNQPPRPVLEPAIASPEGKASINPELTEAARAMLRGDKPTAIRFLKRAAMAGRNAARRQFNNPANGWAPNAPSTIRAKGSDRPGIDTAAMKNAITGLVREE